MTLRFVKITPMNNIGIAVYVIFFLSLMTSTTISATELQFKGHLYNPPCRVDPDSAMKNVIFMNTPVKTFLRWPGRSYEQKFKIKLVNCQQSALGKQVKLAFYGNEENHLPGYISVTGDNNGKLGIGIIDTDGVSLLKLGHVHNQGVGTKIYQEEISLDFKAFVQATESAIYQKSVRPGGFSAVVTFLLYYQ